MRTIISVLGLASLSACGIPPDEDVGSRGEAQPLQMSYFVPVGPEAQAELVDSEIWDALLAEN